ncbi:MAG: oxygen-independent coproporphyrinogen III oxidase [Steroidobacteraceae bacterium]
MDVIFDADLMRRYDREGPRYTSYPTALQFHEGLSVADYDRAARESAGARRGDPLSIYVHIPFCYSPCFYCACNKVITRQVQRADPYLRQLKTEIGLRSGFFDRSRRIEQLHLGGGTPTFLPQQHMSALMEALASHFQLIDAADRDYSIEIDPRTVTRPSIRQLMDLGFNRISLGVQDFDPEVQAAVNRIQSVDLVAGILEEARLQGLKSINFDLIYGLPKQSLKSFESTLDEVIRLRPDRLAVYGYAHMPRLFKPQRQIHEPDLPDAALRLSLLQLAIGKLTAAGYDYIGMDHFALPDDSLARAQRNGTMHRTFQGYTTHASRDLVSFGVSAIGQVGNLYVQNHKHLVAYGAALDRGVLPQHRGVVATADDVIRRDVIQRIMCHGQLDFDAVERAHHIDFHTYFLAEQPRVRTLAQDGLVELKERSLALTPRGRLLMRNVAMAFDAYLARRTAPVVQSRVI